MVSKRVKPIYLLLLFPLYLLTMALLLTEEYLPSNVYDGTAAAKTPDGYDIAQPWIDAYQGIKTAWDNTKKWIAGIGQNINNFLTAIDPRNIAKNVSNWWHNLKIGGVSVSGWFKDDPIGATAGVALVGGATLLVTGLTQTVIALSGGVKGIVQAAKIAVKGLRYVPGIGSLVRWAVGGVQRLWSFNWNQTDAQIRKAQQQQIKALAGRWGEALGATVGTLCGFTLGRAAKSNAPRLMRFNPLLLAKLKELEFRSWAEPGELWEEAVEEMKTTLVATGRAIVAVIFMETYVNIRKLIKSFVKFSGLGLIFPWLGKASEAWGKEGSQPWSFAGKQEKFIDSIKIDWLQDFTEEFVEAAQDMCAESTIIVSYAL